MDCIFCQIINHKLDANIRYENEDCLAFDDINPKAPVHMLIIPKKHIATTNDLTEENSPIMSKLFLVAKQLAETAQIAEPGYSLIMNCNPQGGQVVYHIHLHLIGGKQLHFPTS